MASSTDSATAQLNRRAHALVEQMAAAMSGAVTAGTAAPTAAAVRAHAQAALRSMPAVTAKQQALRDHMMQEQVMDDAVQRIIDIISKRSEQDESATAAASSPAAAAASLLSSRAYAHALSALDVPTDASDANVDAWLSGYLPLLLPSAAPVEVRAHLFRSLVTRAQSLRSSASVASFFAHPTVMCVLALTPNDASPDAWQQQMEMQLVLVRSLPPLPACVLPIASLIDAGAAHMASHQLSTPALRRYQHVQSLLLLEEAKRRARDAWTGESLRAYVSRVRTALRCVPHSHAFTTSYSGELMFLQAMINGLKEHIQTEKATAATTKQSGSAKRARSRSPVAAAPSVPLFHAPAFSALFEPLATEVAAQLCSGCRQMGDVEGELVRWAVLVRSVQHGLPASFQSLVRWMQQRVASFPARTIPLSLRPYLQRFGSGVQEISQLWSNTSAVKLTLAQLLKLLVAIDGDLQLADAQEQESSDDESDAEDEDGEEPSNKRAKTAEFDSLGVSRSPDSLFFLDTGAGSSTNGAAAGAAAEGEGAVADEAHSVAASMSRILRSIPQAAPQERPTRRAKQTKAQQQQQAEEEAEQQEEQEQDDSAAVDAAAAEAQAEAQAEADADKEVKEEDAAEGNMDVDAQGQDQEEAEEAAAEEEEEEPVKQEPKKKAASKAKVKKEAESAETTTTTTSTRTRRATRAK